MPSLVVPNGGLLSLRWLSGVENMWNVLGLYIAPGYAIDQNVANSLAACVAAAWTSSNLSTYVDASTSIATVGVRDLRVANMPEYFQASGAGTGGLTGEKSPNSIACVVTHRTAKAGKSYRGRSFMPLNGDLAIDHETHLYTAPATSAAVNFFTDLRAQLVSASQIAGSLQLAVLSRDAPTYEFARVTPIVSSQVRSQIAGSQRRRLPKRG